MIRDDVTTTDSVEDEAVQTTLLIQPQDLDHVRAAIADFDEVKEVRAEPRHPLDAKDVIALAIEFANHDNAMLLLAFLLGTRTSFQVDKDGVRVEVRNLKTLTKLLKAWKSIDETSSPSPPPPSPGTETDQNVA
jgi:hypothetical protein